MLASFFKDPEFANVDSSENESIPFRGTILRTKSGKFSSVSEPCLSCTTFNILAPIYKRLDQQNQNVRESDFRAFWLARNERIVDWLLYESSSIICLQEFWVGNEELVQMYEQRLGASGYDTFKLARTNNRGDGLLTAIHKEYSRVLNYRELLFNDFGDRVAQLLHVQSVIPFLQNNDDSMQQEILIVNTHLLFPHDSSLSIVRLHQEFWVGNEELVQMYEQRLGASGYDTFKLARTNNRGDWVSHRNHRGNICGVDFIWLRNPNKSIKPLKISWAEAAFGIIKYQLQKASLNEKDAFDFLRADNNGNYITYSDFCDALKQVFFIHFLDPIIMMGVIKMKFSSFPNHLQLKLTSLSHGLSFQEMKNLWVQADVDGNGVLDYDEFKRIWYCTCSENIDEDSNSEDSKEGITKEAFGFAVKNAILFPREVEKGIWPENYHLSDHARLTALFSPVRLRCSQKSL
ncbi:hypothetical protein GOBAR_AA01849 [Gossypium barbadense]|uniref:EF-hand domain-containing protein n=1 Tax=Gossypium barbadense TaxID=3634 RepID=A0A2P5YT04_GOSBA|nr:hypothetical protein GOBAR_AA01849 [Gossypium barbadense]